MHVAKQWPANKAQGGGEQPTSYTRMALQCGHRSGNLCDIECLLLPGREKVHFLKRRAYMRGQIAACRQMAATTNMTNTTTPAQATAIKAPVESPKSPPSGGELVGGESNPGAVGDAGSERQDGSVALELIGWRGGGVGLGLGGHTSGVLTCDRGSRTAAGAIGGGGGCGKASTCSILRHACAVPRDPRTGTRDTS